MADGVRYKTSCIRALEDESIHIIREAVAEAQNPVMLYSIGKDSSVMLHLAKKAFYPARIPFSLLHIDTGLKFFEMYEFRDTVCRDLAVDLKVYSNTSAINFGMSPNKGGTVKCCAALKTQALLNALREGEYDVAMGGARREEERSRAKERIFSFRDDYGQWNPKKQRPELWNLYNGKINPQESIRVFPLSNWTEFDIWHYIYLEEIPVVSLYFAKKRSVIEKNGLLIPIEKGSDLAGRSNIKQIVCRFRTLGCYPCTGAIQSLAQTPQAILEELRTTRTSERIMRIIDHDVDGSMEDKKREGYF